MMNAVATIDREPRAGSSTPADLLRIAVSNNADIDKMEKLMALQERWEANEARKAYVAAMTAFKANPPVVYKDRLVSFSGTEYRHATLADVVSAVCAGLAKHGLSHRWEVAQADKLITVKCIVTHEQGHSESVQMSSEADVSGKKNAIQAIGSAVTYLQRYTLQAITGVATQDRDEDDDGRGSDSEHEAAERAALRDQHSAWLDRIKDCTDKAELDKVWKEMKEPAIRALFADEIRDKAASFKAGPSA
jgi:hypothetical protein